MKYIKKFDDFINEAKKINESSGRVIVSVKDLDGLFGGDHEDEDLEGEIEDILYRLGKIDSITAAGNTVIIEFERGGYIEVDTKKQMVKIGE